ncbi:type II secretion system protein [Prochlorococcus marinus XMU1411]|uniref:type II secretion system protein n=1 Tax=Prochlorococcus marinus TaxID=1219 RepID=UPI001ADCD1E7|nr:type II secretion system protein [Prochlorococcus marinus]MBO8243539.1 type II secretion system protein [Prochlorococcus marinus XMU1411]MCR8538232.1 type II secretion system GspH family protein [Prochlorococcus marinus CUG1430]
MIIKKIRKKQENGFSIANLSVALAIIGILATMLVPNFSSALEFLEVLVAEKYLLKSVRECQSDLIKNELSPQYDLQINNSGIGIFKNNKYIFSYTGNQGACINEMNTEGNRIKITKSSTGQNLNYSLIINVITGEKTYEGQLPVWLDWWEGAYSPIIPENDPLLNEYQ